jgi:hypothetical protein
MSFDVGGLFKSLINPMNLMQLAMGPAGWAAMAVRTIGTAIGKELIQAIGQKLGLPQPFIDFAKNAFSAATGTQGGADTISGAVEQLAQQFGLSPVEAGRMQRDAEASLDRVLSGIGSKGFEEDEVNGGGGKKSFLVALAKAMGALMDKKAAQMEKLSGEITDATGGEAGKINGVDGSKNSSEATKLSSKTALLQAYGQELGILSNTFSTIAKSFGEAQVTNARKG